jgi:phytanoyl-CoA hydroxylase
MLIGDVKILKKNYDQHGFIVVNEIFSNSETKEMQLATEELIDQSRNHKESDSKFDLEKDHSKNKPRVQRIKVPHEHHIVFSKATHNPKILEVLKILLGGNVRLRNSKLNIKAAQGGSPVDWHQDWAFYPHTNQDLLAVGIMIDKIDEENAPLMILPKSHLGKTLNHHHNGIFSGSVDLKKERIDTSKAIKIKGNAGSASFHHVKALHGSSPNFSNRDRRLLLFEYAAADAWPLVDFEVYGNYSEYEEKMVIGKSTLRPRCENVEIIIPYPRLPNADSIYKIQESRRKLENID